MEQIPKSLIMSKLLILLNYRIIYAAYHKSQLLSKCFFFVVFFYLHLPNDTYRQVSSEMKVAEYLLDLLNESQHC